MTPLLSVSNLDAGYGPIRVLHGLEIEVQRGEIVALIGANGAGKTTTLMTLSRVHPPRAGRILFDGEDLASLPPHEVVRRGLIQVPEGRKIFPRLTVRENLLMGAFTRRDRPAVAQDYQRLLSLFPILRERQGQLGGLLSGGQQQMLAIARALMARPKLLMLDEPSLGLAPQVVRQIFDVIRELNQSGVAILLVEQNARMALRIAHRGYVLETGRITLADHAHRLLDNPKVRAAYLGE